MESTGGEDVVRDIEACILQNDISSLSRYFETNLYISLRGGESGYFSANQALYILQNYFQSHKFVRLKFSTVNLTEIPMYATGGGAFQFKGSQEPAQIYVAVNYTKGRYFITQFCVY